MPRTPPLGVIDVMNRARTTATAAGMLLSLLVAAPAGAQEVNLREGQPFPEIFLPTLTGDGLRSVSSFRGKKLVLHVFASW